MKTQLHSAMLARHVYLCAAIAFAAIAFVVQPAQAAVIEAWVHRYSNVVSNANDWAVKVVLDAAGGIIVTGSTDGGITGQDMLTIKYSGADGSVLWQQRYNGPTNSDDFAHALAVDASGNVIVTGSSYNTNFNADYYTAKYAAANGALLWEKRYDGPANRGDYAQAVAVDANGNVVVTGFSYRSAPYYTSDYYTAKYAAADGALLWEKRYDGPANREDYAHAVAVDGSGNVIVTGASVRLVTSSDYYTAKYAAADGALLWEQWHSGPSNSDDYAYAVAVDGSGNVVVTGSSGYYFEYDNSYYTVYYTAKYAAADGALLWERHNHGLPNDYANAVAVDASGNVVVTGTSYSTNVTNPDYYTAKYAAGDGALLWEKRYNGPANSDDYASAVAVDGNGNVVVTGSSYNGPIGNGNADYYTAKYAAADGALLWQQRYNSPANEDDTATSLALGPNGMVAVTGGSSGDYATVVYRELLSPLSIEIVPAGVRVRFPVAAGRTYELQRASAVTGSWSTLIALSAAIDGVIEYTDTKPPPGQAFYRTAAAP